MTDLFDAVAMYDEDYLHFFANSGDDPRTDNDAELIRRLAGLRPGATVLDLGCGHGRIANRLAASRCRVTGVDSSEVFLDRARSDAAVRGVDVEYRPGDMRTISWAAEFDLVVNWGTAFGYFEDDVNRDVLTRVHRALRPGGHVVLDLNNLVSRLTSYVPSRSVKHTDGDLLVDRFHLAPLTSRLEVERTIVRSGRVRTVHFVVRLFGFPELEQWLHAAGFDSVTARGEDGAELGADHERMVVVARRPPES